MKFNQLPIYAERNISKRLNISPYVSNVWVIGDIHGCAIEFEELCQKIKLRTPSAIIIQVGDLIDRGPHVKQVFDVVDKYDVMLCIGNHELNFLLEHYEYKKCNSKARQDTHDILALYNEADQNRIIKTMQSAYNYIEIVDYDTWLISHSPIKGFELKFKPDFHMMSNAWDYCSRNEPYDNSCLVPHNYFVHGHQHWNYNNIEDQVRLYNKGETQAINVDGGVVYGGELVAFNICNGDSMIVKAKETYFNR